MWKIFGKNTWSGLCMGLTIGKSRVAFAITDIDGDSKFKIIKQGETNYTLTSLEKALRELQIMHKLKDMNCRWVLCNNQYQTILIDKPKVLSSEYRSAALWQIKELLSFPIDDCVIDVFLPAEGILEHSGKLYVVVAQLSFLKRVIDALHDANISVTSIITQEFSMRDIVSTFNAQTKTVGILTCNGNDMHFLTIFRNNNIIFFRHFRNDPENELIRTLEFFSATLKQPNISQLLVMGISTEKQKILQESLMQFNSSIEFSTLEKNIEILMQNNEQLSSEMIYAIGGSLTSGIEQDYGISTN